MLVSSVGNIVMTGSARQIRATSCSELAFTAIPGQEVRVDLGDIAPVKPIYEVDHLEPE